MSQVEELSECRTPFLIGVRHCSPACAVRMDDWLSSFEPDLILLELPADMSEHLAWLAHPETVAPVALAGAPVKGEERLFFYPFADFSPELAALRWARRQSIEVRAFDLPAGVEVSRSTRLPVEGPPSKGAAGGVNQGGQSTALDDWIESLGAPDFESFWDRLVEAPAPGATAEALRQAALMAGWVQRLQDAAERGVSLRDLTREAHMRSELEAALARHERVAVVVGSFHAAALLPTPLLWVEPPKPQPAGLVRTSLIAYSFDLLDSRSGYPAGIRDPIWQQEVYLGRLDPEAIYSSVSRLMVELCRSLRAAGHAAGSPDAQEGTRMAIDLSRLRGLPAPGRRELLEAIESCMAQGELLGRGRALARALQGVLVGGRRGRLAPGAPRTGLTPHVHELLARLGLPTEPVSGKRGEPWRLDPLRSPLDRSRHVTLMRLRCCGVQYAGLADTPPQALTSVWTIDFNPSTEATLELAGFRGVTLAQVCAGSLFADERPLLLRLELAAECALSELVDRLLDEVRGSFLESAGLVELMNAIRLVDKIARHHIPGLPEQPSGVDTAPIPAYRLDPDFPRDSLLAAAVRSVEGLAGSEQLEDVLSLQQLVQLGPVGLRLSHALHELAERGSPLMQGAGTLALLGLSELSSEHVKPLLGSWVQGEAGPAMAKRLQGALAMAGALLESYPDLLEGLQAALAGLSDDGFLARLSSLREGFDALSPAARSRFLVNLSIDEQLEVSASWLAALARANLAGLEALSELALVPPEKPPLAEGGVSEGPPLRGAAGGVSCNGQISLKDRWRLILGRDSDQLSGRALRAARALDELYGGGHGEGSGREIGGRGSTGSGFPSARVWALELEELFGETVRQEVLGRASERGRSAALLELDPDSVIPSVELLEQALSLRGGLAEASLGRLRRLVENVTRALVEQLSRTLRPALHGLSTARPTRRANGRLDLARTVRANLAYTSLRPPQGGTLKTARPNMGTEGDWELVAERLVFRTRVRRSLQWRVVLVVDVSGSMESSVSYSALMAAILAGLPAVSVHFVAFSTEVIDFSERVTDPLGLLMEVQVGGGTLIASALRYARGLLTVPQRSLVLLVTDFEDGGPLGELLGEVRSLVEAGARPLGLAALSDDGKPRYCVATAEAVADAGMPVAALTPLELARWVGDQIRE